MKKLNELIKKFGESVKIFSFEGSYHGESEGFPKITGTYNTVSYGELQRFTVGNKEVDGYTLVAEEFHYGNEFIPARYIAIYAKNELSDNVKEVLTDLGLKFQMPAIIDENGTIKTCYHAKESYTTFLNAKGNGIIRNNMEDVYLFADVKNGKIINEWREKY